MLPFINGTLQPLCAPSSASRLPSTPTCAPGWDGHINNCHCKSSAAITTASVLTSDWGKTKQNDHAHSQKSANMKLNSNSDWLSGEHRQGAQSGSQLITKWKFFSFGYWLICLKYFFYYYFTGPSFQLNPLFIVVCVVELCQWCVLCMWWLHRRGQQGSTGSTVLLQQTLYCFLKKKAWKALQTVQWG